MEPSATPVMRNPRIPGDQRRDHDRARDGAGALAGNHLPDISHL
jgi:hypothetical protein